MVTHDHLLAGGGSAVTKAPAPLERLLGRATVCRERSNTPGWFQVLQGRVARKWAGFFPEDVDGVALVLKRDTAVLAALL